jgi:glycosyltransferase involved in cell wall biosynthesis
MISFLAKTDSAGKTATAPATRRLRVLSNIPGLANDPPAGITIEQRLIDKNAGRWTAFRLFFLSFRYDVMLLDGNPVYLNLLCLLRWLWPFWGCPIVSNDICFVQPHTWKQRVKTWMVKILLKKVRHFAHYFKDLDGYSRYFGITPARSSYVPFKVNGWEKMPPAEELNADGAYIFTGGRSLRDLDTFVAAMRHVCHRAILLLPPLEARKEHGTTLELPELPANVEVVRDDGSAASWHDHIRRAKIVVVTTLPSSIRAIGISTYLVAMAYKKCVVMTDGPATRDILHDEAILTPAGDPAALAAGINRAVSDDDLRERTAAAGRRYAEQVAGTARLHGDLLALCAKLVPHAR